MFRLEFHQDIGTEIPAVEFESSLAIGRADDCDLRLEHPSVSRHHLVISREGTAASARLLLTDLNSANGTYVNGQRLARGASVELKPGDEIRVGIYHAALFQARIGKLDDRPIAPSRKVESIEIPDALQSIDPRDLRLLYQLALNSSSLEPRELIDHAVRTIRASVAFGRLSIVIKDDTAETALSFDSDLKCSDLLPLPNADLIESSMESGGIFIRSESGAEEDCTLLVERTLQAVCVPIRSKRTKFGALSISSAGADVRFGLANCELLRLAANTIAEALERRAATSAHEERAPPTNDTMKIDANGLDTGPRSLVLEERRTRALIAARDAAEEANRMKSEFVANVSHELRTPLHAIMSFADLGMEIHQTGSREKLHAYFSEIHSSGVRLLSFVNDLLDLERLESGKLDFELRETDIAKVARSTLDELRALAEMKSIQTTLLDERATQTVLEADEEKLKQVFLNLLANAIKFSPVSSHVQVLLEEDDESVSVSVSDDGPGVPEQDLEAVFEKFVQSGRTKTGAGGTGLGLSICKRIIQGHGGRIWALNRPEGGSRFTFTIPHRQPYKREVVAGSGVQTMSNNMRRTVVIHERKGEDTP